MNNQNYRLVMPLMVRDRGVSGGSRVGKYSTQSQRMNHDFGFRPLEVKEERRKLVIAINDDAVGK